MARTIRLTTNANLRAPVLHVLAQPDPTISPLDSAELSADIAEIEGATSGRRLGEAHGTPELSPQELVAGVTHARFISAAFIYGLPKTLNRFNGPSRAAWYAALEIETCLAEVIFHLTRELDHVGNYDAVVEYIELYASFAGEFADLRKIDRAHPCLNSDPDIAYPIGNAFAQIVLQRDLNGIIYPSVRNPDGTCLAALRPSAVQSVAPGGIHRVIWQGSRTPTVLRAA